VTVLTILQILGGIVDIVLGILLAIAYAIVSALSAFFGAGLFALIPGLLLALAIIFIGFGLFSFVLAYGLWTGRGWAWILSIVFAIIGLILAASNVILSGFTIESLSNIVPIVLYALILVYLSLSNVRSFFGHGPRFPGFTEPPFAQPYPPSPPQTVAQYPQQTFQQPAISQPQAPPTYAEQPQQPRFQQAGPWGGNACRSCGTPAPANANFCSRCGARLR
jgi:hypothetical protein